MGIDGVRLPAPRLEDYGDISHPGDLLCPSCGLVLMFPDGALGTLAVAAAEGVLLPGTAWVASEGGFGVIVPTGGPPRRAKRRCSAGIAASTWTWPWSTISPCPSGTTRRKERGRPMDSSDTALRPAVEGDEIVCPSCGEPLNYSLKVDCVEHVNYEAEAVVRDGRVICVGDGQQLSPEDAPALSETPRCGNCWQPLAFDEVSWE